MIKELLECLLQAAKFGEIRPFINRVGAKGRYVEVLVSFFIKLTIQRV
ncbi:MAG: hypothetical protein KAH00_03675 [Cocleimonas sp.]|nr:hypothetical protein [Cocleimonas sp.]